MTQVAAIRSKLPAQITRSFQRFWGMALIFLLLTFGLRLVEAYLVFQNHVLDFGFFDVLWSSVYYDLSWSAYFLGLLLILHLLFDFISSSFAKIFTQVVLSVELLIQAALTFYFSKTLLPLGKDLFAYGTEDLLLTVQASGQLNVLNGILFLFALLVIQVTIHWGSGLFEFSLRSILFLSFGLFGFLIFNLFLQDYIDTDIQVNKQNVSMNKVQYLSFESFDYFMYPGEYYFDFYLRSANEELFVEKDFVDSSYPFVFEAEYPDVLSPFFDSLDRAPDLVFVLIESLGKAYSGEGAYLGSFTPYLDSLEQHSLVWTNAISSTGRTFGLLPGILSGLPLEIRGSWSFMGTSLIINPSSVVWRKMATSPIISLAQIVISTIRELFLTIRMWTI